MLICFMGGYGLLVKGYGFIRRGGVCPPSFVCRGRPVCLPCCGLGMQGEHIGSPLRIAVLSLTLLHRVRRDALQREVLLDLLFEGGVGAEHDAVALDVARG